ncbi:MAG: glycoside hydrolase family 97 protein [Lacibacter sp.]|jgi:alpha-glucosidase
MARIISVLFCIVFISSSQIPPTQTLVSPNGVIKVLLSKNDSFWLLTVYCSNKEVMKIKTGGLSFEGQSTVIDNNATILDTNDRLINETYTSITGKTNSYRNFAKERIISFKNQSGFITHLIMRAYNDGFAFRYAVENKEAALVIAEQTAFVLPKQTSTWAMEYKDDCENYYLRRDIDSINHTIYNLPILAETQQHQWLLLHEADVLGRSIASSLTGINKNRELQITWNYPRLKMRDEYKGRFEELLANETYQIKAPPHFSTPWRMVVIGDKLASIVESTLAENLNPPAKKSKYQFEAGVAVFPWWANHNANQDKTVLKNYADAAAEMKWKVLEFDVSLIGSPDLAVDKWLTTPWIKEVTDYAHRKGLKVYGWDERRNLNTAEKRKFIFSKYKELGLDGIKIDFINSLSKEACDFRYDCLTDALSFGLMVSFHGEYTPRGERRTFPNLMTQEGVMGGEQYWSGNPKPPTALHNVSLVFTRNVIGPMDYTPTVYSSPLRTTTYAHETACAFAFESGWVCMADAPEQYLNSPVKELLQEAEAAWDETKLIAGHPDAYAVIARRKGTKWLIAGLNSAEERTIELSLEFLKREFNATVCTDDAVDAHNKVAMQKMKLNNRSKLKINMKKNGGFVVLLK